MGILFRRADVHGGGTRKALNSSFAELIKSEI
jgi:hypothetical protein